MPFGAGPNTVLASVRKELATGAALCDSAAHIRDIAWRDTRTRRYMKKRETSHRPDRPGGGGRTGDGAPTTRAGIGGPADAAKVMWTAVVTGLNPSERFTSKSAQF
ncbi:hypothetical protein MRX96_005640 [Rhipicephalus microplus]